MDIRLNNDTLLSGVLTEDLETLVRLGVLPHSQSVDMSFEDYAIAHNVLIPKDERSCKSTLNPSNEDFSPKTVTIGNQVWMAENLVVNDGGDGIYHNPENNETYYTWDAAMRIAENIPGWHLPTALEWNDAALACGATENPYRNDPNRNDYKDAQEFKDKLGVKLVGYWNNGSFLDVGSLAYFWTDTEYSSLYAHYRNFSTGASMDSNYLDKTNYAFSVRLVKDSE